MNKGHDEAQPTRQPKNKTHEEPHVRLIDLSTNKRLGLLFPLVDLMRGERERVGAKERRIQGRRYEKRANFYLFYFIKVIGL